MNTIRSQSKRKEVLIFTLSLSSIGLFLGLISLLASFTFSSPTISPDPVDDPLPDLRGFIRFIGYSFSLTALFSFIGGFLFYKENKIGWLMLFIVYLTGTLLTAYLLFFAITRFPLLALASPMLLIYFLLLCVGLYILYNLIFKVNYFFHFPNMITR